MSLRSPSDAKQLGWLKMVAEQYGYLGIFFISFLGAASIVIPIPYTIFIFTAGSSRPRSHSHRDLGSNRLSIFGDGGLYTALVSATLLLIIIVAMFKIDWEKVFSLDKKGLKVKK